MRIASLVLLFVMSIAASAQTGPVGPEAGPASLATKIAGMKHQGGLIPLDWDARTGKIYLEIPRLGPDGKSPDLLFVTTLPYGTGSNDLGLDRGQLSEGRVVHFQRSGPKVLLIQPNLAFRSSSPNPAEQLAVTQSFAESVLWGFTVSAESPDGTVLVDATEFALSDEHRVTERLAQLKQGAYKVDAGRSTIVVEHTKAFPRNTAIEAQLTFTSDSPAGRSFVSDVSPDAHAMTLRERTSFIELPAPGFASRRFNPRSGYFPISWRDYTAPLGDPLEANHVFVEDPVIANDLLVEVAQERKRELLVGLKRLQREERIHTDTEYAGIRLIEPGHAVAERAQLLGAYRAEGRGEERQHDRTAPLSAERDRLAILVG